MYSMDKNTNLQPVAINPNQIKYSRLEEWINIITHLVGAVFAVVASVLMIIKVCVNIGTPLSIVATCLFSLSLINLYVMSTLYHAQPVGKVRRVVFRRFDHCSVAFLIAGTYAPYMLIGLGGVWGIVIASVVLAMAVLVIIFNAINVNKFKVFSLIAYVLMGWACVFKIIPLYHAIGSSAFAFLLSGGIVYTLGIIFYKIKKIPLNHAIWHVFVLVGTVLHFISIYQFILV